MVPLSERNEDPQRTSEDPQRSGGMNRNELIGHRFRPTVAWARVFGQSDAVSSGLRMASSSGLAPPIVYDSEDEPIFMPSEEEKEFYQRIARQRWMSGGSLIRDAKTDKATLAKVPDVTAAPAAIPEAVTDVFVAEHTRDFPQLGVGSACWLGGRLLAATRGTINLNMSVLDQVRMEPMLWLAAAGLQCDRAFHARRVPPTPVYVQSAQPGSGGCSNQMVQCQHAPVTGVQPLLSLASGCKQRRSARSRAPVEPAAEQQRMSHSRWCRMSHDRGVQQLRPQFNKFVTFSSLPIGSQRHLLSSYGKSHQQKRMPFCCIAVGDELTLSRPPSDLENR